jgi:hypothetical protein
MEPERESPSTGDLDGRRMAAPISHRTFEAAAEFERAIAAAERAGPSPNVHPTAPQIRCPRKRGKSSDYLGGV